MGTLKQVASSIATKLNRAVDFEFLEVTKFDVLSLNALLARREYEKTRKFPTELVRKLSCIPLVEVDSNECCELESGCKILRTVSKIPATINVKDASNFLSITGEGNIPLPHINHARLGNLDSKFGKFTYYTMYNNYIYVFNNTKIEYISLSAVFVDIRELGKIKDCAGIACFDESSEVNIPDHYIPVITDMLLQKYNPNYKSQEVEVNRND